MYNFCGQCRAKIYRINNCSFLSSLFQTTYILKRRFPPVLDKKNRPPKLLKTKNFVYDLEENTNLKAEPDLKLILTSFVEGELLSAF